MSHQHKLGTAPGRGVDGVTTAEMDQYCVNVIKGLIMDAVRKANSGHTGGPLSSADFAYILFREFYNYSPDDPAWFDRDRFVLSAGHESALLYTLLMLVGYLDMSDLKQFRQLHSRTPGHPEHELTPGVEATTGPLGQGFGMAAGMAIGETILRATFGEELVNHYTYVIASDGDLQEPVTLATASLVGHLGLGRLIVFYDKNRIQLSGPTEHASSEDFVKVFEGFQWHIQEIDGHNHDEIRQAIIRARDVTDRPSLIIGHTIIARGCATMEGSEKTHGEPLPPDEIRATKLKLGLPPDETFYLPPSVVTHMRARHAELRHKQQQWKERVETFVRKHPEDGRRWQQMLSGEIPSNLRYPDFTGKEKLATRVAFGDVLTELAHQLPGLVGGSADLEPSNMTAGFRRAAGQFSRTTPTGRCLIFGVREFPMGAICNGLALHGGLIPFGATFLVFSDYERAALRMAALQKLRVIHEFTHDSIFLGEDGPTHQPIEHLSALRAIPGFVVIRPADATETITAVQVALEQRRPTAIILSRQALPVLDRQQYPSAENLRAGGYILYGAEDELPDIIYIATGSEVHLALQAAERLQGFKVRVVNLPSWELFEEQPEAYRNKILPPQARFRISLEAGSTHGWKRYTGPYGHEIGLDRFGASAPMNDLAKEFGFTAENVVQVTLAKYAEYQRREISDARISLGKLYHNGFIVSNNQTQLREAWQTVVERLQEMESPG